MAQMIAQFNEENIRILQDLGFEVHLAANFTSDYNTMSLDAMHAFSQQMRKQGVFVHQIDFERGVGRITTNVKVWNQLRNLADEQSFDLIHCQSPLGGVFGRLIGKKYHIPTIYTAHGFHFYKGGPIKNWLLFYPIERYLARFTDCLITINHEDFSVSNSFPCKSTQYVPGVGVDVEALSNVTCDLSLRDELDIPRDAFTIISCGELSVRKNEQIVIKALSRIHSKDVYYVVVGKGEQEDHLKALSAKLHVEDQLRFVGYQANPAPYYAISNVAVFPSRREGLGLAGIEAMATGLPLITTNIGGIADYSIDGKTGYVAGPDDAENYAQALLSLKNNQPLSEKMGRFNKKHVKQFSQEVVNQIMFNLYSKYLK